MWKRGNGARCTDDRFVYSFVLGSVASSSVTKWGSEIIFVPGLCLASCHQYRQCPGKIPLIVCELVEATPSGYTPMD